jgi:hypothetical protein
MKTIPAVLCLLLVTCCLSASGQSTAFTYQGRLNDGANPASGIYDLRFTIYSASSGGSAIGGPLTNSSTSVSNGLFVVTLDFGAGVFTGPERWLEIDVRSNSMGGFTALSPRQALTAAPYALYAKGANAAGLTGALPPTTLNGIYSNPLTFNNGANSFSGSFYGQFFGTSFTGCSFAGDGSGLINLNASQISEGTFPASSLGNAWRIVGNNGTTETNFIGTTDNQALDFRVANIRGFRIEPDQRPGNTSANIIGGSDSNRIERPASGGSVIVGGGFPGGPNIIRSNSSGVFIGGGSANEAGPNANDVTVAGGFANAARTYGAVVGGGGYNLIETNSDYATIGGGGGNTLQSGSGFSVIAGGYANSIQTNSGFSTMAGGYQNEIQGNAARSAIGGGIFNKIQVTADESAIAGGNANQIFPGARESFIGGGFANQIRSNAYNGVIGGGAYNVITNAGVATIGGGEGNTNNGFAATVAGGFYNTAIGNGATVGGGGLNVAAGFNATVVGGDANQSLAPNAFVGGGFHNTNSGNSATIAGGFENNALAPFATVPGGYQNRAAAGYSFAAGRQAKANHLGAFVWADSTAADFSSAAVNEFAVRASGGLRFVSPGMSLNGQPVLTASATNAITLTNTGNSIVGTFNGDGAGLTNLNAWRLGGNASTTPGINFVGTADNQPLELKVNNARALRLEPTAGAPNVIGGDATNAVAVGVQGATISGGQLNTALAGANYGTIGGGYTNRVGGLYSTVVGGTENEAGGVYAAVGGGLRSRALGFASTVGGGSENAASGDFSTVPGGAGNAAIGHFSFAAGRRAKVFHNGTFAWADDVNADFSSTTTNQFAIRAQNGVVIQSATNGTALEIRTGGAIKVTGAGQFTGTPVFIHRAMGSNISGHITAIDHPLSNNDPNAILIITPNWTPSGIYNTNAVGVWYNGNRWTIFNQNLAPMLTNSAFNVLIVKQ